MKLPSNIVNFLKERQANADWHCDQCNSACCNGPGFALFENIEIIYEKYISGTLLRSDYIFEVNLSLSQFIFKYFDRTIINGRLLVFFPKTIATDNSLISIPPYSYWEARNYLFRRQSSNGCIFLNKKQNKNDYTNNYCILHNANHDNDITEKPMDCLFLYCKGVRNVVNPTTTETTYWFSLLDYSFPNSVEKFNKRFPELID